MDFHILSRRELQALCKKNKIPANLTNVAMADALQALQLVEGIDEIILASESSTLLSPKETIPGLADTTLTARRTSVRKKPTSFVSESPQLLNHMRRTTRRSVAEKANEDIRNSDLLQNSAISTTGRKATASAKKKIESQVSENENDDIPAPLGTINVPETPAMESCQSRVQGASSRSEIQALKGEKSVQRVYSTRRSVRLLRQSMEKLNLKELCVEHITIDGSCNETQEVKEVIDVSGIDLLTTSEESLQNVNDLKVLPSLDNVYDVNLDIMKGSKQDLVSMLDEGHGESDESSIQNVFEAGIVENLDFAPASSLDMPKRENEFADWNSEAQIDEEGTEDPEVAKLSDYRLESHVESLDKNSVNIADEMFCKAPEFSYVGHHFPLHETISMGNVEESIITNTLSINACDENEITVTVEKSDLPLGNFFHEQLEIRNETKTPGIVFENESCKGVAENLVLSPSYATSGSSDQSQKKEVLEELLDIEHESLCKQISPCKQLDSAGRVTGDFSPFLAATLQNLFPCPVVLTPGKSSAERQTTIEKIVHDSDINKENVSNGWKIDPNVEKANKNEKTLDEMSLRQLTKMLKEKLQIANKKNEDKDIKQVEQRPALQTLAENCMPAPHPKGRN
ncbi:hypothetical protein K2173_026518 [Erythroxylum novogranatense]|uniref:Uncharacterized protein n=1 Tax=Erythroxylum novogranatense TaxID=1862640 RepID=A0AAV8TWG4_9ROSI|nr:hypothetical protein K2173_026518 [Erythroxylum novogranatense]